MDLDLDLDVNLDRLVRGKLSIQNIYQIALYLCMSKSTSTTRSKSKSRTPCNPRSESKGSRENRESLPF